MARVITCGLGLAVLGGHLRAENEAWLNQQLEAVLDQHGFTGEIESTLAARMGRPIDPQLADLGRLLFFDELLSLHNDNACAGCHTPAFGFGDPQSMAYGVGNNRIVGPFRDGTRNSRKAPPLTNVALFPALMLNSRFASHGDPYDNSQGFIFPGGRFATPDPLVPNLLTGQAFMPVQDQTEMAGFQGTAPNLDPRFDQFDDGVGTPVPDTPEGIWEEVLKRINAVPGYRQRFSELFGPGDIVFGWVGQAIAEFQISLLAANAPIDAFARGDLDAMTPAQKRGALLFFGKAQCVGCHAVSGPANEMFSDFEHYVLGIPQVYPLFGVGGSNVVFDGPGENEDFGRFQISGDDPPDLYAFRTSPIRNVAVQAAFFHNGAFVTLEDAIAHHLNAVESAITYDPAAAGIADDLHQLAPVELVLSRLDPVLSSPIFLTDPEFQDLVEFVRDGLLDPRALPSNLCRLVPDEVPSGLPLPFFEGCQQQHVPVCHGASGKHSDIAVRHNGVYAHLRHGDRIGPCEPSAP